MKKEDFKNISIKHIKFCKRMIENGGICYDEYCENCPFNEKYDNTIRNQKTCELYSGRGSMQNKNNKLVKSSKEFLKIFGGE